MNKVILIGRLTKDPEIRYTQNNTGVVNLTIAVDGRKDEQGNKTADFINCVAWGQSADFLSKYIKKGFLVSIVGKLQTRNYQGQDGQMHYVTEVFVENLENLTPKPATNTAPQGQPQPAKQGTGAPRQGGYPNPNQTTGGQRPRQGGYTGGNGYQPQPQTGGNGYQPQPQQYQEPYNPNQFDVDLDEGELPY